MKSSKYSLLFSAVLFTAAAAQAAHVDMNDPRRALGREDDIRVDAQLVRNSVSPGSAVSATYQVQNLTSRWIAIADKIADVSYDADSRTITLSLGAEIPNKTVPHLTPIAPGEKKTFSAGSTVHITLPSRGPFTETPRFVQIKVNVLRDVGAFADVLTAQAKSPAPVKMTQMLFDAWLDSTASILLNQLPVDWNPRDRMRAGSAEDATAPRIPEDAPEP
jgi:hypothetical protein